MLYVHKKSHTEVKNEIRGLALHPQVCGFVCHFFISNKMLTKLCEANVHFWDRIPGVRYTLQSTEQELNQHTVLIC